MLVHMNPKDFSSHGGVLVQAELVEPHPQVVPVVEAESQG